MATAQHGPLNLDAVPSAAALRIAVVVSEWNAEITENLYVLLVNGNKDLNKNKDWNNIIDKVNETKKLVVKDYPSFTSRSKFKHMDIVDCLKK